MATRASRHLQGRYYLETDPHRFIEGTLIGAHIVQAGDVYIYIATNIGLPQHLEREIAKLRRAVLRCICGAAPALTFAARNLRCSKASRASAACRATSRLSVPVGLFGLPT